MRPLLVSTSDLRGGAAHAARRLCGGLRDQGLDARMLVQEKASAHRWVIGPEGKLAKGLNAVRPTLDELPLRWYSRRKHGVFSIQWVPGDLRYRIGRLAPDVVNLHWVGKGFARIEALDRLRRPLVWTLHDMWAFTGGCHHSYGCDRYVQRCGRCPRLGSNVQLDLSRWVWVRKARAWPRLNLTVVSPSRWLAQRAASSSLFRERRVETIPNGVDTDVYRPIDERVARDLLGLPQDRRLVLFAGLGATDDPNKGFRHLRAGLNELVAEGWGTSIGLVVLGGDREDLADPGYPTYHLGVLGDDVSLAATYAAADVAVVPSAQENLPNTVMEALACGTPCVAFRVGGIPDMIVHRENGYLARPYEVEDLAQGIAWVIGEDDRHRCLSQRAREEALREFTLDLQARRYATLFGELVEAHRTGAV